MASASQDGVGAAAAAAAAETHRRNRYRSEISPPFFVTSGLTIWNHVSIDGKKPLPAALPANACWFPSIGSEANNDATTMTKILNVMVVFECTVV